MTANPYLSGNFAPLTEERTEVDLEVTGAIPSELSGRLLRIGPNPLGADPATHHWFVGSGMVHGLQLRNGKAAWYRNRFVRDEAVVEKMGWPALEPFEEGIPGSGGVANTNVIVHAGKTLAIVEAGNPPVELSDHLETLRRSDFDGTWTGGFSAHPKRDPDTGELHAAVYSFMHEHVTYVVVGADGKVRKTVDVPVPGKPMVHDCAITKNWFVILDLPVTFSPNAAMEGAGLPYRWDPGYGARVGLLPRDGDASQVVWSEVGNCYVYHPMNAYEDEAGRVVMEVARHPRMFDQQVLGPDEGAPTLDRWIIDPKGGPVKEERLDDRGQEFPRHDERLVGKPYRFGYTTKVDAGFDFRHLIKHDLQEGRSEIHDEGPTRQFMEAVFVPRSDDSDEDDGWVMAYLYDKACDRSDVVILHAQDFSGKPVATIHLPGRVPFGFHGNWAPDA